MMARMIESFRSRDTEKLFNREDVKRFSKDVRKGGRRKLEILAAARTLGDLRIPPGNKLEALEGNRKGQHSIRINDQWRICFVFREGDAYDVEITDYH
jgi:toxin HigB-1